MKKYIPAILVWCQFGHTCLAQEAGITSFTSDHFVGVQMNNLIKQVFNSTGATGNPYLLTYSSDSKKTGWGFRIGAGYSGGNNSSVSGSTTSTSSSDVLQFRVGVERAYKLTGRWSAGAGMDLVFNNNNSYSASSNQSALDSSASNTRTITTTVGGGAMGWLHYNATKHLVLGTEASFYYVAGTKHQTVDYNTQTVNPNTPSGYSWEWSENKQKFGVSSGAFSSPIVFFLMVRF